MKTLLTLIKQSFAGSLVSRFFDLDMDRLVKKPFIKKTPMKNNLEKEFVPYKEALALNELGFDEPCFATIDQTEFVHINGTEYPIRGAMDYRTIDLPTFSQAFRWFREKYELFCWIEKFHVDETYIFQIPPANFTKIQGHYITYEEAELACLRKLIEIVKSQS